MGGDPWRRLADTQMIYTLKRLHANGWNIRDVLVLDAIRENPGRNGLEISRHVSVNSRSLVDRNIKKLIAKGLVKDDREKPNFGTPNKLHVTPDGEKFLGLLQ